MELFTSYGIGLARILTSSGFKGYESEDQYYRSYEPMGGGLTVRLIPLLAVLAMVVLAFEGSP